MQKLPPRPLQLVSHPAQQLDNFQTKEHNDAVEQQTNSRELIASVPLPGETQSLQPGHSDGGIPEAEHEAGLLLKRTPGSYLLNQAYGLWVFVSLFLVTVIVTRKLSVTEYGVYAVAMAAFNTIAYIVAFGLEDATTTYIPRVFAEYGKAAAAVLIRRLLLLRLATMIVSAGIMLFAMPLLAALIAAIPLSVAASIAAGLRDPTLLSHIAPIGIYVLGNGISSLITSVCASFMRMRFVFVVGCLTQLFILVLSFFVLQMGWGTNGILWLFAISSLFSALAFIFWASPLLFLPRKRDTYIQPLKPVVQLGISAWLTNLVTGALLKQVSIILLGYFAISIIQIGYFNLSFQLAHAASLLLVSGFGGVAGSAMAAAFVGHNYDRLARSWQALIKIETLLAAPVLMFCLFNARNIAPALYGANYDPVGPLLAIFLFFNIIVRILGTSMHQYALYVIGKARLVVLGQWLGLITVILFGTLLIPHWGPAGALVADGLAQVVIGSFLLAFLWHTFPRKYPLNFTLRFLLGLFIAALPSIIWQPSSRLLLVVSGTIFLVLCLGLMLVIKPLQSEDLEMIGELRGSGRIVPILRWFARGN